MEAGLLLFSQFILSWSVYHRILLETRKIKACALAFCRPTGKTASCRPLTHPPPGEKELVMYQKATVLDILALLEKGPNQTYTQQELKDVMMAYVEGLEEK